jgi:hypothetical protein
MEVTETLTQFQPSMDQIQDLVQKLTETLESCPVLLPDENGNTAPLTLHEVLIERYVRLLRLDKAPERELVDSIGDTLKEEQVNDLLTFMRLKNFFLWRFRTSFMRTNPWPLVKLVTRPPARAKPSQVEAAECSDLGSRNISPSPQRFFLPLATAME